MTALRALVTDGEERAALAACRSLHRAGYRVTAAATSRPAAAHLSRSVASRLHTPDPRQDDEAFVWALERRMREVRHDILLPGNDSSLLAISEHRDRLTPLASFGLPPPEIVARTLDKACLLEAAAVAGLDAPRSFVCLTLDEARVAMIALGHEAVVKPSASFVRHEGRLVQRTAAIVRDGKQLELAIGRLQPPYLVQELVVSPSILSCGGVVAGGRLRALACSRYVRTWPPEVGSSSYAVTVAPPADVAVRLETLLREIGWEGIFQVQLFEREDGRLQASDLNTRVYGSISLAIAAGADLPAIWCAVLRGEDPAFRAARTGVGYRWEEGEIRNLLLQLRRRRVAEAISIVRPRPRTVHAYFRANDPAPLAARPLNLLRRRSHAVA